MSEPVLGLEQLPVVPGLVLRRLEVLCRDGFKDNGAKEQRPEVGDVLDGACSLELSVVVSQRVRAEVHRDEIGPAIGWDAVQQESALNGGHVYRVVSAELATY